MTNIYSGLLSLETPDGCYFFTCHGLKINKIKSL